MNTKLLFHTVTLLLTSVGLTGIAAAQQMNYQGRLTNADGNALSDGAYTLRFNVYTVAEFGSPVWGPSEVTATLVNGRFNVILGEDDETTPTARKLKAAFTSSATRYLGITLIDAVTNPSSDEISPRQTILSSPNAMFANNADHAGTATAVGNPGDTAINVQLGKVGINQATPTARLHVDGNTADPALKVDVAGTSKLVVNTNGGTSVGSSTAPPANGLRVQGDAVVSGNVGIGTSPGTLNVLRLNGTIGSNNASSQQHSLQLEILNGIGNRAMGIGVLDNGIGVIQAKEAGVGGENAIAGGYQTLLLNPVAGSVVIGTSSDSLRSVAKLVVGGFGTSNAVTSGWDYNPTNNNAYSSSALAASIHATHPVQASAFRAFSDARIKTIEGRSDGAADLVALTGLEITDYRYKDVISKGSLPQKKVIAQQVESVYPQAVSKITDVVPDIYQNAIIKDGWVTLTTDLKKGERVRLIGETEEGIHEVLEVREGAFRTDFEADTDKVFVFGREVNDFRTVDYEAIAMLNVSATQELHRRLETQEAALASKTAEISALKERLEGFDQKFAKLERLLGDGSTVTPVSIKRKATR